MKTMWISGAERRGLARLLAKREVTKANDPAEGGRLTRHALGHLSFELDGGLVWTIDADGKVEAAV